VLGHGETPDVQSNAHLREMQYTTKTEVRYKIKLNLAQVQEHGEISIHIVPKQHYHDYKCKNTAKKEERCKQTSTREMCRDKV
jgi:hypothetical protein